MVYREIITSHVALQVAVVIKTPEFDDKNIEDSVPVSVQLVRPSDGTVSKPKTFTYLPLPGGSCRRICFMHCAVVHVVFFL